MTEPGYALTLPLALRSCAVFSSPHSGAMYPAAFLAASDLTRLQLRSSEDAFVDELFAAAPGCGAPLLAAGVPRACIDFNRAPSELDPALISGVARRFPNARIAAGLGVIPRVVGEGRSIIQGKMPLAEAERRIAAYWHPYHDALRLLLAQAQGRFGSAILFDCHSMPRDAVNAVPLVRGRRPEIVLGDRFGASCGRVIIEAATDLFSSAGFIVTHNAPFAGGYITQTYGRPQKGIHALQIEIDRSLYMDEAKIERTREFDGIVATLSGVVAGLAALGAGPQALAAE